MADPFMLVSLNEDKAKKLSQVLASGTATKILNHLSTGDATESEISKKLKIPLSTVHYNLKQLAEANLVVVEEFHYSSRGKEVNHYKLANKYIIIAPAEEKEGFLRHLKKYLPVAVITAGVAVVLKAMQLFTPVPETAAAAFAEETVSDSAMRAAPAAAMETAVQKEAECILPGGCVVDPLPWWQSPAIDWLLLGALGVLVLLALIEFARWRSSRNAQ